MNSTRCTKFILKGDNISFPIKINRLTLVLLTLTKLHKLNILTHGQSGSVIEIFGFRKMHSGAKNLT